jgi:predicted nucleic acid-binding protein
MKETAFWDASALVPLCVPEAATLAARSHMRTLAPAIWWGSLVEIQSAICRLHRERSLTDSGKQAAVKRFEMLYSTWREIPAGDRIRELAFDLLGSYPLKAGDSLQLAASLIWCDERPAGRTFVCGDQRLSRVAQAIGFAVLELFGKSSLP